MEPLKAGYVAFGTQFYKPERLKEISARAEKQLTEGGIELARTDPVAGEGREPPQWVEMGVPLPSWPSVKFYPDGKVRSILDHVLSRHFGVVFGDHAQDLAELCALLGIKTVVD